MVSSLGGLRDEGENLTAKVETIIIFILISSVVTPHINKAHAYNGTVTIDQNNYDISITEKNNIRHVIVKDNNEQQEATYNLITEELILNDEVIPKDVVEEIKNMETQLVKGDENNENMISPLANEQGGGGSYKHFKSFNIQLTGWYTLANLLSITIAVVVTIISSVIGTTLKQAVITTIATGIVTGIITQNIPSLYITVHVYQTWFKTWTGKYASYIHFYSDKDRKNLLKIIYDAWVF